MNNPRPHHTNDQVKHRIFDAVETLYDPSNPSHPPFNLNWFPGGQEEYVLLQSTTKRDKKTGDFFCWWHPEYLWNRGNRVHGLCHPKRERQLERSLEYMWAVLGIHEDEQGVLRSNRNHSKEKAVELARAYAEAYSITGAAPTYDISGPGY